MKRTFFVIAAMVTTSVFAQDKQTNVPVEVKNAFKKNFTGVSNIKWEKEGGEYEVSFSKSGKQMSAVYSAGGNLKETEEVIAINELPVGIDAYVAQHYKGSKIKEAAKIKKANGEINYEAEVNKVDVLFDSKGKFLKEVKE
ncbi:PepSY-like domain-containing protein [Danxiaibacter flavus]|uniref:PepSY-like domain-containing protein n=1 Tax=Danxiaibacter flavus TaxID=3049108 RepID=A0ABV3ZIK7_9BACT|nr:PepSY-like domain-containing protein [Chitinophagaceae bacterium DXS]